MKKEVGDYGGRRSLLVGGWIELFVFIGRLLRLLVFIVRDFVLFVMWMLFSEG